MCEGTSLKLSDKTTSWLLLVVVSKCDTHPGMPLFIGLLVEFSRMADVLYGSMSHIARGSYCDDEYCYLCRRASLLSLMAVHWFHPTR